MYLEYLVFSVLLLTCSISYFGVMNNNFKMQTCQYIALGK